MAIQSGTLDNPIRSDSWTPVESFGLPKPEIVILSLPASAGEAQRSRRISLA